MTYSLMWNTLHRPLNIQLSKSTAASEPISSSKTTLKSSGKIIELA